MTPPRIDGGVGGVLIIVKVEMPPKQIGAVIHARAVPVVAGLDSKISVNGRRGYVT